MSASPPLKPWTELPEKLRDLPRKGFARRPPATTGESMQSNIIYGVDSLDDLFEQAEKRPETKPAKPAPTP